ncbi:MAG TPA: hypothetical protein VND93_14105, partial [Myxococcales bacterium]|nr:hypothetical protein [Myxococcales bacterium]
MALHLEGGLAPGAAGANPRAQGEPALARWLSRQMPDPAAVFAKVSWRHEGGAGGTLTPSMADLGLAAVDLFYLLDEGGARSMAGFDEVLIDHAEQNGAPAPRHDAVFELEYRPAGVAGLTLFDLAPLARALRGFVLGARPLRPTDLALQSDAGRGEDAALTVRVDKAQAVLALLQATAPAVQAFAGVLEAAIGEGVDGEVARDAARDQVDQWMQDYAAMVRPVVPFGLRAASLTAAVEGRRGRLTALRGALDEVVARWDRKADEYDDVMAAYSALPGTATDEERTALLVRAGRIISTSLIAPLPSTIGALETAVEWLRTTFGGALSAVRGIRDGAARVGATLQALTGFLPTYEQVDQTPFDLQPFRDSVLALAQDLLQRASALEEDIEKRASDATDALGRSASATAADQAQAAAVEAARAVLGADFMLLPELALSGERLAEWENAWNGRGGLLAHLTTGPEATPFPVEDWLHGVARVRERPRHLERTTLLGEALGAVGSPALEVVQLPYRAGDAWLGLRFPDGYELKEDKLLYTAHFGPNAEIDPTQPERTYSGLMLDEWVEVIPTDQLTTGLAFHFDRPGSEAPQAILLATPPEHRGGWRWQDLVETLHETLDFARLRAVEPAQLDRTALGPLVPAVLSAVTLMPITAMLNFAFNNNVHAVLAEADR